jgi:hypothetical protein
MPLTVDVVQAAWNAAAVAVMGHLKPQSYDRRIVSMAIEGPAGSTLKIYTGHMIQVTELKSSVFPASSRLYDSELDQGPITIFAGQAATFAWTGGSSGPGVTAYAVVNSQWGRG